MTERLLLKIRRVPIALRLFLTVLLTTLVITTVSLGVLHWTMQKNFAKYVADVEMQKLDHLIDNLAGVYSTYHDWGNAIQAQILQIEGHAAPDDYDRLSRWWLRCQYDIALQQRYFKENTKTLLSDVSTVAEQYRTGGATTNERDGHNHLARHVLQSAKFALEWHCPSHDKCYKRQPSYQSDDQAFAFPRPPHIWQNSFASSNAAHLDSPW